MALFKSLSIPGEIDRDPELRDRVIIFAYLEELMTLHTSALLEFDDELTPPIQIHLEAVNEAARTFDVTLSRALPSQLPPKAKLPFSFTIEQCRLLATVPFLERAGYLKARFAFPESVQHDERRQKPRARFSPRDAVSVTVLESLFEGHGIHGRLLNLSMGGACVRIDRAMAISGQRRIAVNTDLFPPGAHLDLIRLHDLPHIPLLECTGSARHMERTPAGVVLGLRFESMDSLDTQLLAQSLKQRLTPEQLRGFPLRQPKSRRSALEAQPPAEEPWEDLPEPTEGAPVAVPRPDSQARLLALKKRGKRILVLVLEDMDRAILAGTLQADGFTRVAEAKNFLAANAWLKTHRPDLLILEHPFGTHTAQQVVEKLRAAGHLQDVPIVMIAAQGDVRATLMAKAAHIDLVVHPPVDYDGLLKGHLMRLLALD